MTELIPVKHHWWTNFGEDGAWAWYWHLLKCGCIIPGHSWRVVHQTQEDEAYLTCPKCGSYRD